MRDAVRRLIAVLVLAYSATLPAPIDAQSRELPPSPIQSDRQLDGNRLLSAPLPLGSMLNQRISVDKVVIWVAGYFQGGSPGWIVQFEDGSLARVSIRNGQPVVTTLGADRSDGLPLSLSWSDERGEWAPNRSGSLPSALVSREAGELLPDGNIAAGRDQVVAFLTDPTESYPHGVLGDRLEAGSITILSNRPARTIVLAPHVAEERGVLLYDLTGDGSQDIITTLADRNGGAFVAAFSSAGEPVAAGPSIGRGFRWRHLIGAGPIGPSGESLLAVVRTPHIGGVLEYYDSSLSIVASAPGYSSHQIGSRSLGDAWIVDTDGDLRWEVLLPVQDRRRMEALTLGPAGVARVWSYDLGARLSSNLGMADPETDRGLWSMAPVDATTTASRWQEEPTPLLVPTGRPGLLLGSADGVLHVWW